MGGFNFEIGGHPFWFWLPAFGLWLFFALRRQQRLKERRQRLNPFKGLNLTPGAITCPRCHASWPGGYEPRSHRELMWKVVVCPTCGCEYDDRGRERTNLD